MADDPTLAASTLDAAAVRRLADELEIRNIIARLALIADGAGSIDEYISLFTEDAEWLMPGAPRHGHDHIREGAVERRESGQTGEGSNTRHVVSTIAVNADGGDTATSRCYFHFYTDTVEAPKLTLTGVYDDTFVRTPEGWKLARRDITWG